MMKSFCDWRMIYSLLVFVLLIRRNYGLEEGDSCDVNKMTGVCKPASKCDTLAAAIKANLLTRFQIPHCGFTVFEEMICCPILTSPNLIQPVPKTPDSQPTRQSPTENRFNERPAAKACRLFDEKYAIPVTPHILGGVEAEPGEFPHMAALGYPRVGAGDEYAFNCGGSLIDPKFVLTAAHCVYNPNEQPRIVRMGTINLKKPSEAIDVNIARVHLHWNYTSSRKYNDIALLELETEVAIGLSVRPACLLVDPYDLPEKTPFYATGWGQIATTSKNTSDILLKAELKLVPLDVCNISYSEYANTRHLERGIINTQLCAGDANLMRDACQGDSGGPLNAAIDDRDYRIAGVVSAGYSCGTTTPGLYTNVSAFLDFIEEIVWANR